MVEYIQDTEEFKKNLQHPAAESKGYRAGRLLAKVKDKIGAKVQEHREVSQAYREAKHSAQISAAKARARYEVAEKTGYRQVRTTRGKGKHRTTTTRYEKVAKPERQSLFRPSADQLAAHRKRLYGV